eukprot:CAMPEP_0194056148 /NCGR_PEP_ID=MMETSP0009_2-20130614/59142_1 /TAXON_ID=210454 /ORGANISM="Grammatophora oceanica, Strain CCMP 410" /LENGTH=69 /DNA_ID=CAMNT_0038705393 /DNA_START=5 /DNA_END=210 /DNA_ORIENTATION=-
MTAGCEGCPVADTCAKLCRRCENRAQLFGGLDCDPCDETPTPPSPTPPQPGECWAACEATSGAGWICAR